jgi:DNA-binding IclR family transcriptional regulator
MAKVGSAKANMPLTARPRAVGAARKPRARSGINSGLDILEQLAAGRGGMSLTEIAQAVGMSKSGVHGLLAILTRRGFVARDRDSTYHLGARAWEVASASPMIALARAAAPHMVELMQETQEGVILGVLDGADIVYCHLVDAPQAVRVHTSVGDRIPAHCTSTGLALLAELDDAAATALLPATLAPFSPQTITSRAELLRQLARVRRSGHAVNLGGWREDVGGVACVVRDRNGAALGGLCVSAPRYRVTPDWFGRVTPALCAAAARIRADFK